MVQILGEKWIDMINFVGFVGPNQMTLFHLDRFEVTNRDYQKFVDSGGYTKQAYSQENFVRDGRQISGAKPSQSFATLNRESSICSMKGGLGEATCGPRVYRFGASRWWTAVAVRGLLTKPLGTAVNGTS